MDFTKLRNPKLRSDLKDIFEYFTVGSSVSKTSIDASKNALALYTTSPTITGAIRSGIISQTMTVTATANQVEVLRVELVSNVKTGAWANAIVGSINYSTSGAAHGMAAAICAEMIPPNGSLERGGLYCLDCCIGPGANSSWASAGPVAFVKFENWGTVDFFNHNGYLFNVKNLAADTGHIFHTIATATGTHGLRILIDGVGYDILLKATGA